MQFFDSLCATQGSAAIFNACKSLKMKEAGNRVFRFRGWKSPEKGFFNILLEWAYLWLAYCKPKQATHIQFFVQFSCKFS